jgi:hypothetical protein
MELTTLFERGVEIRQAASNPNGAIKQRIAAAAAELSNAGNNQARVDLLNEAVMAAITLCYETDPDGALCNIDRKTYRILVKMPWGRVGWQHWGLRFWEAEILRSVLRVRSEMRRVSPLFDWNEYSMKWHINYSDYGRIDQALLHWKANPITLKDWRLYADAYRQRAQQRMERHRDKQP